MAQAAVRQYEEDELLENTKGNQKATKNQQSKEKEIDNKQENSQPNAEDNNKEEDFYHYTVDTKDPDPWLKVHKFKLIALVLLVISAVAGNWFYGNHKLNVQTKAYISDPKLNDLYYIDFRAIQTNLRPTEKYRMAKVADITGDIITLNFSSYFYPQKHELGETIRYAQLRFDKFFQEKRNNYSIKQLQAMIESGAIMLARRPEGNMLDGNLVIPDAAFNTNSSFLPGKKENFAGLEFLKHIKDGNNAQLAFNKFQESAEVGYAEGQVNLAQMYINKVAIEQNIVEKDYIESLAWLKKGALQAYEPAVLKYAIVCQQVESCTVADFYQELVQAGVNIEFATKTYSDRATTKELEKINKEAELRASKRTSNN